MKRVLAAIMVAFLVLVCATTLASAKDNIPSSKTSATSSQVLTIPDMSGQTGTTVLSSQIKTAEQKELLITVSAESVLINAERAAGSPTIPPPPASSTTSARLIMAVTVDGTLARPGSVVLNDRYTTIQQSLGATAFSYVYDQARTSNSFTFVAVNVGAGVHTVAVQAWREGFTTPASGTSWAAYVGKRTLVVEETQMAKPVEPAVDTTYPVAISTGPDSWALTFKGYAWLGDYPSAEVYAEWGSTPSPPSGPVILPNVIGPLNATSDGPFSFGPVAVQTSTPTIYWWRAKVVYNGSVISSSILGVVVGQ